MPKEIDEQLFAYIYEQIATMSECDLEEQKEKFVYTMAVNEMIKYLKERSITFDPRLLSEELLSKVINEFIDCLPK